MQLALNDAEMSALAIIANPNVLDTPCRTALEKLIRLDLVEPAGGGLVLSPVGRDLLTASR